MKRVYVVFNLKDPCELPCGVFGTLRECAEYIGVTLDHLKHSKVLDKPVVYCTKYFVVEGVVLENE